MAATLELAVSVGLLVPLSDRLSVLPSVTSKCERVCVLRAHKYIIHELQKLTPLFCSSVQLEREPLTHGSTDRRTKPHLELPVHNVGSSLSSSSSPLLSPPLALSSRVDGWAGAETRDFALSNSNTMDGWTDGPTD